MENYKVTLKSQINNGWQIIAALLMIFGLGYFLYLKSDYKEFTIVFFTLAFLFQLIPQLVIHIRYFLTNKNDELTYDFEKGALTFSHGSQKIAFHLRDIQLIKRFVSFPSYNNNIHFFTCDYYNHSTILLNNGTQIIITSLMVPYLDLPVDANRIEYKKGFYRWIFTPSLSIPSKQNEHLLKSLN